MRVVYILGQRGTLHKATQLDVDGPLMTSEGDNADEMKHTTLFEHEQEARRAADRLCRRCWPGDRLRK